MAYLFTLRGSKIRFVEPEYYSIIRISQSKNLARETGDSARTITRFTGYLFFSSRTGAHAPS